MSDWKAMLRWEVPHVFSRRYTLPEQIEFLTGILTRRPRHANSRRTVSAAEDAVFHFAMRGAADMVVGYLSFMQGGSKLRRPRHPRGMRAPAALAPR